jgi:HD-like signal output (HDOD) protein
MQNPMTIALLIVAAAVAAGFATIRWLRRRPAQDEKPASTASPSGASDEESAVATQPPAEIAYWTEASEEVMAKCLKLAFGVARFDYQIFGEHARVLELVELALADAAEQQRYFPRRPLLLPKLLQALNDTESTRHELVSLILEDPVLAGTTLKRANNAFYRVSAAPVESLDRAVIVLGTDGLRSLLSTAILQPVFRLPKGFFDRFAEITWEQAQRSAASAQAYAEAASADDPFIAQVLGVLRSLASLVLFRLTLDTYQACPNVLPRPEVFIRVLQAHRHRLAVEIAKTWQLSAVSVEALAEQCRERSPTHMSSLGKAVYYGELTGALTVATHHGLYSREGAHAILLAQGLTSELAARVYDAGAAADLN